MSLITYLASEFGFLEACFDVVKALGRLAFKAVLQTLSQPLGHRRVGDDAF